ncbi:MAG: sodium ion-translocating decarboxylase subunit beta [bacterium]|nr:sodium ion-translocating decarboxylase subunit beta [bacterium]
MLASVLLQAAAGANESFMQFLAENIQVFLSYTGFANATPGHFIMLLVGLLFIFLAIKYEFEPMLLIPIGFGILIGNIPFKDAGLQLGIYEEGSVLNILYQGVKQGWYPPLIFLGIGAMTDFSALISNPKLILIGAAAQFGIFGAYMIALALGFEPNQAAGIAIIGGADGPTAIFLSSKLSPNLMGAIAVCAYSYMALVPVIQPPLMRLLTTKNERVIKMKPARQVSQSEKILFPIIGLLLTTFIVPSGLPLLGMLFFGNLLKESGKTTRLAKTAGSSLNDVIVMLLGLTVGCSTQASEFLTLNTVKIFALGALAFIIASASGILFVKLMNVFLPKGKKINPLIGNAGVSAVPMSARISNNLGLEYDRHNFLLMHAMGPNVAGVIGSAVAAGALLGFLN